MFHLQVLKGLTTSRLFTATFLNFGAQNRNHWAANGPELNGTRFSPDGNFQSPFDYPLHSFITLTVSLALSDSYY